MDFRARPEMECGRLALLGVINSIPLKRRSVSIATYRGPNHVVALLFLICAGHVMKDAKWSELLLAETHQRTASSCYIGCK